MTKRRIVSLSILSLLAILLGSLAPILLLIAAILSIAQRFRSLPHALLFALGFLFYECMGVIRLFWVWLRHRNAPDYLNYNQQIQYWWAGGLLNLGKLIYGLTFEVSGKEALVGSSALLIARHTSIGDTVLPMLYFAKHRHEGMRYVLKRELTIMPCLDIAGHRLPNLFVDRSGSDTDNELKAIKTLTSQASDRESVLIYPEGTRFTPSKQKRLRKTKPELGEQLDRWPNLLPPRLGGVLSMLAANPGKDIVFLAHTGFEGAASLSDLVNGSWCNQQVRLHFWRIPYTDIPTDHQAFFLRHWDKMQSYVANMP